MNLTAGVVEACSQMAYATVRSYGCYLSKRHRLVSVEVEKNT